MIVCFLSVTAQNSHASWSLGIISCRRTKQRYDDKLWLAVRNTLIKRSPSCSSLSLCMRKSFRSSQNCSDLSTSAACCAVLDAASAISSAFSDSGAGAWRSALVGTCVGSGISTVGLEAVGVDTGGVDTPDAAPPKTMTLNSTLDGVGVGRSSFNVLRSEAGRLLYSSLTLDMSNEACEAYCVLRSRTVVLASREDSVTGSLGPFIGLSVTNTVAGAAGVELAIREGKGVAGLGRMYYCHQYTICATFIHCLQVIELGISWDLTQSRCRV